MALRNTATLWCAALAGIGAATSLPLLCILWLTREAIIPTGNGALLLDRWPGEMMFCDVERDPRGDPLGLPKITCYREINGDLVLWSRPPPRALLP